jgi:nicotinate-nucleotide pyrophosphorylase (carboxylating)
MPSRLEAFSHQKPGARLNQYRLKSAAGPSGSRALPPPIRTRTKPAFDEVAILPKEFQQIVWDTQLEAAAMAIVRQAIREDLGDLGDLTSRALVPEEAIGRAAVVPRHPGALAGMAALPAVLELYDPRLQLEAAQPDGASLEPGQSVGTIEGPARSLLTAERVVLNLLGRLSGIATLTRRYVDTVAGTSARIYDTRKTTPGWRLLEKYAVRCGGGRNHRAGLYAAVLIKDNHLAFGSGGPPTEGGFTPAEAVLRARRFIDTQVPAARRGDTLVEVEVDTLAQLEEVLPSRPDIVLLDNMGPEELQRAVALRDRLGYAVELEASGGVDLETVEAIARSGVERISVGALTHSAVNLDIGLDWLD